MKKAVILLSGGLDSVTCLAMAKAQGFSCYALSFAYGQRHAYELTAARNIVDRMNAVDHRIVNLDIGQFGASALTDTNIAVPSHQESTDIPVTYVPARNTIFLSIALGFAESIGAHDIFIGANAVDYSNYPDCRPSFIQDFQNLANIATKAGVNGNHYTIHAPLLHLSKAEIIQAGVALGVDYRLTVSCYQLDAQGAACGDCASCMLRKQGFAAANILDPTVYKTK
jgi:7-cyano-7-deazaguanine synthase